MTSLDSLEAYFGDMPDPGMVNKCDHRLFDILMIAICAVLCGAEGWEEIQTFGESRETWLRQWLTLPNGIPSHDTVERVFNKLAPDVFEARFFQWVQHTFEVTEGQVIAIDGKVLRGAGETNSKVRLELVSAWASANGIVLGQRKVAAHSNEVPVLSDLLDLLVLKGCIVTLDAQGCQTEIAQRVMKQQADYVLAVKQNQGTLYRHLEETFSYGDQSGFRRQTPDYAETADKGHGRWERRCCWALPDQEVQARGWVGCQTVVRVLRERVSGEQVERETAYYISSLPPKASLLLGCIRAHWSIENSYHWVLDVTFHDDQARTQALRAAENLAVVRRMALNLLARHTGKGSRKRKRFRAALDENFLLEVLHS